jgi:hypothetical protein
MASSGPSKLGFRSAATIAWCSGRGPCVCLVQSWSGREMRRGWGKGPLQREIERRKRCDKRGQRAVAHVCQRGQRQRQLRCRRSSTGRHRRRVRRSTKSCLRRVGASVLLGVRELILLASTSHSLKHMLSGELDSRCSVWYRCCANETSSHTARIMSAVAKYGKNTCVNYLANRKILTVKWFSSSKNSCSSQRFSTATKTLLQCCCRLAPMSTRETKRAKCHCSRRSN